MSTTKLIDCARGWIKYHPDKYVGANGVTLMGMSALAIDLEEFGNRVREARNRVGYSQVALVEALHQFGAGAAIGQSQISTIENGGSLPSVQVLYALAVLLETNTDYLLGLSNDDSPPSDKNDQVIATVEDPMERAVVQAALDAMAKADRAEKLYAAELIQRIMPKPPRIIGG